MPKSDDIVNLFRQFGGQADEYQEISRANTSRLSRARWSLLTALDATGSQEVPAVQPAESAGVPPPLAFCPAPMESLADAPPVVETPGVAPPLGTPVAAGGGTPPSVTSDLRAPPGIGNKIPPPLYTDIPAATAIAGPPPWARQEPSFAPDAAPTLAPADAAPLTPDASPLARLVTAPADAPALASEPPAGELQAVFARLAGSEPPAPAPSPIAVLWRRFGGGV